MNPPTFVESSPLVLSAFRLASERHRGQRRKADGADFLFHPLEVGALLHAARTPEEVVAAGILHDVLEKSDTKPWEIEARCSATVRELVEAVSEDPSIADRGERKAELRRRASGSGREAALVFAADKISKLREWRLKIAMGTEPPDQTMVHYRESLEAVERSTPDHPLTEVLRFELEALASLPPNRDGASARRVFSAAGPA